MTEIPSHIASSAAPASYQAKEAAKEREARRAGQADTAERQVKAVDEQGTTVDTEDADTAIFADAEGTGSQGRPFEEGTPEKEQEPETPENGVTRGKDGQLHLDLEA
jgi:hypothetical protein